MKLNIRNKLLLGFLVVLVLTGVVGFIGFTETNTMHYVDRGYVPEQPDADHRYQLCQRSDARSILGDCATKSFRRIRPIWIKRRLRWMLL